MNRSLIIIVLVFTQISAAAEEPKPVRVFDDFETWEWKPITAATIAPSITNQNGDDRLLPIRSSSYHK